MEYKQDLLNMIQQEINEVEKLKTIVNEELEEIINIISNAKGKVVFSGVGKSAHIGRKLSSTFSSVGIPSYFLNGNEALHGDLGSIEINDIVILISNSGNTNELCELLDCLNNKENIVIALTGNSESYIAKNVNYKISLNNIKELSEIIPAPTCSSTCFIILGDIMAMLIAKLKNVTIEEFGRTHPGGSLGKNIKEALKKM